MSRTIEVTPAQVAAARLQIIVDAKLGQPTPEVIRKIASAMPAEAGNSANPGPSAR